MIRHRLIAILFPALLFVGCQSTLTPEERVYHMQGQLDIALEQVEIYAAQPPCYPPVYVVGCHDLRVVLAAIEAAEEADYALDEAEEVVRSGGTNQDIALYINLARAALARIAAELAKGSVQ